MFKFEFRGLMAPVFTPFDKFGKEINLDIIPKYAKYLSELGIHGILVNGTTGEGPSLKMSERILLADKWAELRHTTGQTLMVQVGGAPMPEVLEMARRAAEKKVDALLCLPELYFKPTSSAELLHYLSLVGAAAPDTPLLYYHIPAFTNVNINMAEFLTLAYETGAVPTLAGIKFTSCDLNEGSACLRAGDGRYAVFLGADQIISGACALGFDSAIATTLNFAPQYSEEIFQSFGNGENKEAKRAQDKLTQLVNVITKYGSWVSSMKVAMNHVTPFDFGPVREPLIQPSEERTLEMYRDLSECLVFANK